MTEEIRKTEKCVVLNSKLTTSYCDLVFRHDKVLYIKYLADSKMVQIGFQGGGSVDFKATIESVNFIRKTVFGDIDPIERS